MIHTIINTKKTEDSDVVILSAPYEKTTSSRKGTINGPKEVIKCLDYKLEFFDPDFNCEPNKIIKTSLREIKDINKLSPEKSAEKISKETDSFINKDKFVFLLGGEHSVSFGYLKSLSQKYNSKEVTVIQIDAHCDLRDNDGDYDTKKVSKLAHSCVMRRVHELGYNLVQVGIRTYSIDEFNYFKDNKEIITVFDWRDSNKPSIKDILDSIKTKYVYLTIDVDGFDPSFMPGTGTPVQGGLDWWFGMDLIKNIVDNKNLIGADIVEVAPMKDSVLTEYGAAQLLYKIISHKFKHKFK